MWIPRDCVFYQEGSKMINYPTGNGTEPDISSQPTKIGVVPEAGVMFALSVKIVPGPTSIHS